MNLVKKFGIGLLVIIVVLLIVALFISNDIKYEKTISINSPIEKVWEYTNSLEDLGKWNPWQDYDPEMKVELTGTDGTVGAMTSWDSTVEKVGKGSQTITKIEEPNLFATNLKFYLPYESEAKGYIILKSEGDQTKVTWGFESEIPYPFNLMKIGMDMEKEIGKDFELGLNKLKNICEN